jgi:hypothetical protein
LTKLYLGIDNGLHGAISLINDKEEIIEIYPMPIIKGEKTEFDIVMLNELFQELFHRHVGDEIHIFLEKAHARPISGVKQCFVTGFGYGIMQAILTAYGRGFELIEPKRWQKEIFKGLNMDNTKEASIMFCKRKYPLTAFSSYGKAFTDGLTDATCIALYGKRMLEGKQND